MIPKSRVIAAVIVIAAILVGAALLTQGRGDSAPPGILGYDAVKTADSTGPAAPGSEVGGSQVGTSSIVGKDRTQQSLSASLPMGAAAVPAADGADLATITSPPEKTLSMLDESAATPGSTYKVTVQLYGFGPRLGGVSTVVALVTESAVQSKPDKPFALKDRNVLLRLDPDSAEKITGGGSYTGVITLRPTADTLIPWLSDVGYKQ